jgi:hypothetical protein
LVAANILIMMPTEGGNLEALFERVIQMNMIIIEEMQEQRKEMHEQRNEIQEQRTQLHAQLPTQSSEITTADALVDSSPRSFHKLNVRPKEFSGTNEENVVTWLTVLEEVMPIELINENERISIAVSLLGGTALQWFVNLKLKNQRPTSWREFKEKLKHQFQPIDFQEHLRQQLLRLHQNHSLQDYIHVFRSIAGQIHDMDELTQVMMFVNGLSSHTSLYVRSKHPQTVETAIREATTYDNVMTIGKNNNIKYNPFLETSSNVELNAVNTRPQQRPQRYTTPFN